MHRPRLYALLFWLLTFSSCTGSAQDIVITGPHPATIVIPADATKLEQRSAHELQDYVQRISGTQLPIAGEKEKPASPCIYIGNTTHADKVRPGKLKPEHYLIHTDGKDLVICGGSGHGVLYGVYYFVEAYLHCSKLADGPASVPENHNLHLAGSINDEGGPQFEYRQAYYPASHDAEYLDWHQLQQLDDLWGVWGHSYDKLVPAKEYFSTHPEYFAQVNGRRQPSQLCLSNEDVYRIVVSELKKRMAQNPDAIYWSVSPNDDNGYCQCDKCRATDNAEGSPSGSLIKFVNRVAANFPDKKITTLAYGYTHKAPRSEKPAGNVYVFLSDIDAYRDKPLADEGTAAAFRTDLKAWHSLTPNIFIWDYVTEFTNYLAPFPNFQTLQPNMQYFKENGVKGVFAQGSGDTYSEWAELLSYVLAKLFEDTHADVSKLASSFISTYYGKAAPYIQQYFDLQQQKMLASHRKLDIYGNPINEWNSYLTPELLDEYSTLFDKAEAAVESNPALAERVMRARLPLEYTVLQQARFYGIEKHGIFVKEGSGGWQVKPKMEDKVARFVANCKKAGVTELSEAGAHRRPDEYQAEWSAIFRSGVTPTKALGAPVTLQYPFAEDYPAKGNRTLVDGNPGYDDFSYNWLCFYGTPLVATIDLGKPTSITTIKMHFLDDPRHWIFPPPEVDIELSKDGSTYHSIGKIQGPANEEHYDVTIKEFAKQHPAETARYIRVTAKNLSSLPAWRYRENKKPMIACDEVYVQ